MKICNAKFDLLFASLVLMLQLDQIVLLILKDLICMGKVLSCYDI